MNPIDKVHAALANHGLQRSGDAGNQWTALCPAHEDRKPSLSIGVDGTGKVLIRCHAGCAAHEVVRAMGLEMKDLFPKNDDRDYQRRRREEAGYHCRRPAPTPTPVPGPDGLALLAENISAKGYPVSREALAVYGMPGVWRELPDGWETRSGPVYIALSQDAAALWTAGRCAFLRMGVLSRPEAKRIATLLAGREIVVILGPTEEHSQDARLYARLLRRALGREIPFAPIEEVLGRRVVLVCKEEEAQQTNTTAPPTPQPAPQLDALLGLPRPTGAPCPRSYPVGMAKSNSALVVKPKCRRWGCPVCRHVLCWDRGVHLAAQLAKAKVPITCATVQPADWPKIRRRLTADKAPWAAIEQIDGSLKIFTPHVLPGYPALPLEDAVQALGHALANVQTERPAGKSRHRPVTSSRSWSMPRRDRGDWKRVANIQTREPEPVRAALERHSIKAKAGGPDGIDWILSWQWPERLSPADIDAIWQELADLKDPPPPDWLDTPPGPVRPTNANDLAWLDDDMERLFSASPPTPPPTPNPLAWLDDCDTSTGPAPPPQRPQPPDDLRMPSWLDDWDPSPPDQPPPNDPQQKSGDS